MEVERLQPKRINRFVAALIAVFLLIASTPLNSASAVGSPSADSPNAMARSMIDFFRKDRTELAIDRVSRDELMVYGVFLSNFFIPGKTKLSDMVDASTDKQDTIPRIVSNKFFGSPDNYKQIVDVNTKLYNAIMEVFQSSKSSFGLFKSVPQDGSLLMSGEDFYNKLAGVDTNRKIYAKNGSGDNVVMDLNDKATHAAIQVLFSYSPELILDKEKGLRALTAMYIDGLGNIWGAYDNVAIEEYVLVLPAALNPVVFSKTANGGKFPVANVFVMGGIVKITENFLDGKPFMTPYYNIKDYFTNGSSAASTMNRSNMLSIFGIQSHSSMTKLSGGSAFRSLGDSDTLIMNSDKVTSNPYQEVQKYINESVSSTFSSNNSFIFLTIDASKFTNGQKYFVDEEALNSDQKDTLSKYLFGGSVFSLDELADDMYYFNVPTGASGGEGDWKTDDDALMMRQKMFAKEVSGQYQFYQGSYFSSPFNGFLHYYYDSKSSGNEQDQVDFLVKWLQDNTTNKTVNSTSAEFKALKSFLDSGSFGTDDPDTINAALKLLKFDSNNFVYNVLPSSTLVEENILRSGWFKTTLISPTSFGLSEYDSFLGYISTAIRKSAFFSQYKGFEDYPYFEFNGTGFFQAGNGGKIVGHDTVKGSSKKVVGTNGQNAISTLFYNSMVYRVFGMNSTFTKKLTSNMYAGTEVDGVLGKYTTRTAIMNDVNNYPGIYWGYMVQLLGIEKSKDSKTGEEKWDSKRFENDLLPTIILNTMSGGLDLVTIIGGSGVVASEEKTMQEMQTDIVKKIYGLLSDGPNQYRDKLIKSAQDSWIISTHRSITGSWIGNILSVSAGGNESYASIVGYINTPSLTELPITSWLLDDYMSIYLLLILFVAMIVIIMVITHVRSIREGVLIFIVMAFVLIIPQFFISSVVNLSNTAGDKLYSGRFNYWAITQHQQALSSMRNVKLMDDEKNYIIAQNMELAREAYSSDVGVRVKWMSPKKDDVFDDMFNKGKITQTLNENLNIFRWLFSSFINQEEYVFNDPLVTYLYRPYNAIATAAKNSYSKTSEKAVSRNEAANKLLNAKESSFLFPEYRFKSLLDDNKKVQYSDQQNQLIKSSATLSVTNNSEMEESYRYWALNSSDVSKAIFRNDINSNAGLRSATDEHSEAFLLSTESPFYYFYNALKSRYSRVDGEFKSALLSKEVFRASSDDLKVNNSMRDFLDLEGLFTYVIPYLYQGNDYVYRWTATNGKSVDTFNFKNAVEPSDPAMKAKFNEEAKRKEDLKAVWKLYSPWVDQIYSLDVMGKQVPIANKKVYVADTANPGAYDDAGRPMIFSEADMYAKGYNYSQLTDVERRIQSTLKSTYKDLMYLTNYYDFDNEVLITAAAMMATFNFNREFSENRLLGESSTLYPQNFELKNFNYDAFMRLILMNSTGEALMDDQDLYARVLEKTSIFSGLLLILCDLMAVIVVPVAKLFVLLLLLFLTIAICLSSVLVPPDRLTRTISKNLFIPSLIFLAASIGFAFVISLFMGEGLTGYVGGRTPSLGVSDPSIVMLLMVAVDVLYVFILWKIAKLLITSLKSHVISTVFATVGLAVGAMTAFKQYMHSSMSRTFNGALSRALDTKGEDAVNGEPNGGNKPSGLRSRFGKGIMYNHDQPNLNHSDGNEKSSPSIKGRDGQSNNAVLPNEKDRKFETYIDDLSSRRAGSADRKEEGKQVKDSVGKVEKPKQTQQKKFEK